MPKKSITFQAANVSAPTTIANFNNCNNRPASNVEEDHLNVISTGIRTNNRTVKSRSRRRTKQNLKQQVMRKVKPAQINPLNITIPNDRPLPISKTFSTSHHNQYTTNQMYNNIDNAPNYSNYWPERNVFNNCWIPNQEEQWRENIYEPHFQSLNKESTIELNHWNFEQYQCYSSPSLPPASFYENSYLQPIANQPTVCHSVGPNFWPTYHDFQVGKY